MSVATSRAPDSPGLNEKLLFGASFLTLIAAGIGFSVRGAILKDWGSQFGFTQAELGTITGGGLIGFGLTIIVLSFFADWIGYGKLMLLAFLLHASSAVVTFAATPVYAAYGKEGAFMCLNVGMWLFALGNGACESVINPLTAALFPKNKTHWLNILHAGWPGGLILGAIITLVFNLVTGIRWEIKLGVFVIPVLLYGLMMFNRPFPRSEASERGIGVGSMMKDVGMLGMAVVVFFVGLLLSTVIIPSFPESWGTIPAWSGWAVALVLWIIYGAVTAFSPGHIILAFLYVLHALVGYVELGTDSWITNIGNTALKSENWALIAFIWTNLVMFGLRFFAGPIVEKISPLGLLAASAVLGVAGLVLFSQPFADNIPAWLVFSTVYAIGKTFYWPTLLGVISERFPRGGALALGISGGVGMLSAGLLGAPGIGYKQDLLAVQKITELSSPTYERYQAKKEQKDDKGNVQLVPDKKGYPLVTQLSPDLAPSVAGLDNSKLKVLDDNAAKKDELAKQSRGEPFDKNKLTTTLESDLATLKKNKDEGKKVEEKLEKTLNDQKKWWDTEGEKNYDADKKPLDEARLFGAKTALLYTAAVPALMVAGFLLLVLVYRLQGGYKQVHLDGGGGSH